MNIHIIDIIRCHQAIQDWVIRNKMKKLQLEYRIDTTYYKFIDDS